MNQTLSQKTNLPEKKLMEYYTVFRLILINLLITESQFQNMRDAFVRSNPHGRTAAQIDALLDTTEPTTEEFLLLMRIISPLTDNFLHRQEAKRYEPPAPPVPVLVERIGGFQQKQVDLSFQIQKERGPFAKVVNGAHLSKVSDEPPPLHLRFNLTPEIWKVVMLDGPEGFLTDQVDIDDFVVGYTSREEFDRALKRVKNHTDYIDFEQVRLNPVHLDASPETIKRRKHTA